MKIFANIFNKIFKYNKNIKYLEFCYIRTEAQITHEYRNNLKISSDKQYGVGSDRTNKVKSLLKNMDADYVHNLQLGGLVHPSNLLMLDREIKRAIGIQIMSQLNDMPTKAKIQEVFFK